VSLERKGKVGVYDMNMKMGTRRGCVWYDRVGMFFCVGTCVFALYCSAILAGLELGTICMYVSIGCKHSMEITLLLAQVRWV
jgi:hypothetical protein